MDPLRFRLRRLGSWSGLGLAGVVAAACTTYGSGLVGTGGAGGVPATSTTTSTDFQSSTTTSGTGGTPSVTSTTGPGASTTTTTGSTTSTTSSTTSTTSTTSSTTSATTTTTSSSSSSGTGSGTCTDGVKNGDETGVDCGGSTCPPCAGGQGCGVAGDCESASCTSGKCDFVLLLSQVQTRGDNGGNDEFVEIYNPTGYPVVFDANWTVKARSATGGLATCASAGLGERFAGTGKTIPSHGHILYANNTVPGYNAAVAADGTYMTGITDSSSVVLQHGNDVIDALCFYYDMPTQATLTGCSAAYICRGTPILNPHDNTTMSNKDASLERKPGGAQGNGQDTGDNTADFATNNASDPHDLASAPVP